ncbi:MAG: ATP-binding protein [Hormoscilla sp.]
MDYINQKLANTLQRPVYRNFGSEIVITGEKEQIHRGALMAQVCPYKKLESFDFNDEDPQYFFGRTALVDELLDRLGQGNFLAVVGASGSGKSSVVNEYRDKALIDATVGKLVEGRLLVTSELLRRGQGENTVTVVDVKP